MHNARRTHVALRQGGRESRDEKPSQNGGPLPDASAYIWINGQLVFHQDHLSPQVILHYLKTILRARVRGSPAKACVVKMAGSSLDVYAKHRLDFLTWTPVQQKALD